MTNFERIQELDHEEFVAFLFGQLHQIKLKWEQPEKMLSVWLKDEFKDDWPNKQHAAHIVQVLKEKK